ncbi:MAG: hypothetical protein ACKOC9_18395, partial [Alphaproteobacteria bacterium]
MPGEIGIHQMAADAARFRAITAGRLKHIGNQAIQRFGIDHLIGGAAHYSNSAKGKRAESIA